MTSGQLMHITHIQVRNLTGRFRMYLRELAFCGLSDSLFAVTNNKFFGDSSLLGCDVLSSRAWLHSFSTIVLPSSSVSRNPR
jgi:hypothetical protein